MDHKTFKKAFEEFSEAKEKIEAEFETNMATIIEGMMKENGDTLLYIQGWTPGFNDGEPCEHRMEVISSSAEILDSIEEFSDDAAIEVIESHYSGIDRNDYHALRKRNALTSEKTSQDIRELEDILHDVLDTNWQFLAYFDEDGVFHSEVSEYDCGY